MRSALRLVFVVLLFTLPVTAINTVGRIEIRSFKEISENAVMVSGNTDLPEGSLMHIGYGFTDPKESGAQNDPGWEESTAAVTRHFFSCRVYYPKTSRWRNYRGSWLIEVKFIPFDVEKDSGAAYIDGILAVVGKRGEHLSGAYVKRQPNGPFAGSQWLDAFFQVPLSRLGP
jgi:hypothetical protein